MALTQNSTILISDISSALSEKQDKLAYVPVKSVNGTSADANGAVTISTGGGTATAISGVAVYSRPNLQTTHKTSGGFTITYGKKDSEDDYPVTLKFPSGGTWRGVNDRADSTSVVSASGGSTFVSGYVQYAIAIKVA